MAVENGIGLVVVDGPDDVDRLEAIVPGRRTQDVLVRIIPGVTADTHAHVLTGHEGSKFGSLPAAAGRADHPDRAQPAAADARRARARRVPDPGGRAVGRGRRAAGRPRRVPDLRPGRWSRRPVHLGRPAAVRRGLPRRPHRRGPRAPARARRRSSSNPAAAWSPPSRRDHLPGDHRQARAQTFVAVDGGMGDNLEVALFGQRFEAAIADRLDRPAASRSPWSVGTARAGTCWSTVCRWSTTGRRPARRSGHRRLLLHHGQQLQRHPPGPRGVRRAAGRSADSSCAARPGRDSRPARDDRVKCQIFLAPFDPWPGRPGDNGGRQSCLR